ncbi:MAG: twin-arginine translocation signal domain-containing protein [Planctomycetales bacterium]|nr:twin-arginine translocation signal domain-containing protein [Planctomycetales bacterium]
MSAPLGLLSRRDFLAASSLGLAGVGAMSLGPNAVAQEQAVRAGVAAGKRPRVAAINSIYRLRSHAYHIAGRLIHGYTRNGFHHQPPFELVRMWNHQQPENDLGPSVCKTHGIELAKSIPEALGGKNGLDVDAVLLIIEHGDYPVNERGQVLYPRAEFFDQIVEVFRKAGRSVPVFVDKHLSYDHQLAAKMVATAKELKFGLMAGSSLPVTWRKPEIEPTVGTPFKEAVVTFGFDRGSVEIYLFHALEVLQCMLERRAGGETGVKSIEFLQGDAVWKAGDAGRWSWRLMNAALSRCPSTNVGPVRENVLKPQAVLVEYLDGTRGAVLNLIEQTSEFAFAANIEGRAEPLSSCFYLPAPPGARFFDPLTYNIEKFFASGTPPYPAERTLLTSTMTDLATLSQHQGGQVITNPALAVKYSAPADSGFFRGPYVDAG